MKGNYNLRELDTVTLVAVSSNKIEGTIEALLKSMCGIKYREAILITHQKPENLPDGITFKQCDPITSHYEYNRFMIYDLTKYINTNFALVVQYDGYVLRPDKWNDTFLDYDYIGAPWQKNIHYTKEGINVRVGNGGFSLRSKKVMNIFNELNLPFTDDGTGFFNEDGMICNYYRRTLEEHGVKFPPVKIAAMFSRESYCEDYYYLDSFGFHRYKIQTPMSVTFRSWRGILRRLGAAIRAAYSKYLIGNNRN